MPVAMITVVTVSMEYSSLSDCETATGTLDDCYFSSEPRLTVLAMSFLMSPISQSSLSLSASSSLMAFLCRHR